MTDEPTPQEWYFCRKHATVEDETGCPYRYRMGPYATREEASRAYEIARERNEVWDEDPAWNDDEDTE